MRRILQAGAAELSKNVYLTPEFSFFVDCVLYTITDMMLLLLNKIDLICSFILVFKIFFHYYPWLSFECSQRMIASHFMDSIDCVVTENFLSVLAQVITFLRHRLLVLWWRESIGSKGPSLSPPAYLKMTHGWLHHVKVTFEATQTCCITDAMFEALRWPPLLSSQLLSRLPHLCQTPELFVMDDLVIKWERCWVSDRSLRSTWPSVISFPFHTHTHTHTPASTHSCKQIKILRTHAQAYSQCTCLDLFCTHTRLCTGIWAIHLVQHAHKLYAFFH